MSEKISFLATRRNSFSVSSDHFNWKDLLLSAADDNEEEHVSAELRLSSSLALPPVVACVEPTYLTNETSNL